MGVSKSRKRISTPEVSFKRGTVTRFNGVVAPRVVSAVFDTAGVDSSGAANTTIAAHGLGVYIPDNAIVTRVWFDVVTTFTSATDAATLAVSAQSANDIVSAIAISDASNVWDAGIRGSKVGFPALGADAAHDTALEVAALFAGTMLKLTAERELTVTVASEVLTAGKLVVYAEFVLGE